jgi:retinol dehydrogenase-14
MASAEGTMVGRTCIVTGGAAGLGLEVVRGLARAGAQVLIVAPDEPASHAAADTVRQETGNPRVMLLPADLSSQAEVRGVANTILGAYPQVDVVVNALVARYPQRQESVDGIEMTLAVNLLAPFLLTNLLLDLCRVCVPVRVVNISAESHRQAALDLDDLQARSARSAYRCAEACARCRLASLLFTYELSRRVSDIGIAVNAVDPGRAVFDAIAAGCDGEEGGWSRLSRRLRTALRAPDPDPAAVIVALVSDRRYEGVTGQYYVRGAPARSSDLSYDPLAARRLWQVSAELTRFPVLA